MGDRRGTTYSVNRCSRSVLQFLRFAMHDNLLERRVGENVEHERETHHMVEMGVGEKHVERIGTQR